MREHILVGNNSLAQLATRHLHHQMVCYIMKEPIVERDHSAAQNVTSHSQCQMFKSNMREHILVKNHSPAQHAARHLHHQKNENQLVRQPEKEKILKFLSCPTCFPPFEQAYCFSTV